MRLKRIAGLAVSLLVSLCTLGAQKPVLLTTPAEYQLMNISPNGKWACGVYVDYNYQARGFLWNLQSGTFTMLSTLEESEAWAVSNDGTVVGVFQHADENSSTSTYECPGIWKNNQWTLLELPAGSKSGRAFSITPDGQYTCGVITSGYSYLGYIWKDGKIYRQLNSSGTAMPYGISPDGQEATGWIDRINRTACYFKKDGSVQDLASYQSMWSVGKGFSPDGSKILYWGGYDWSGEDLTQCWGVYDIATGDSTAVPMYVKNSDFDFFQISGKGTIVGESNNSSIAYMCVDGVPHSAYQYLQEKGADFSGLGIFTPEGDSIPYMFRTQTISEDDNTVGLLYYAETEDGMAELKSVVVKFDVDSEHGAPAEVTVNNVDKRDIAKVLWMAPVGVEGIQGYHVYRDGERVNDALITATSFYDKGVKEGPHTYQVETVCADNTLVKSEEVAFEMKTAGMSQPISLFARQKGINSAYMQWDEPMSNYPTFGYYDYENPNTQGFGVTQDGLTFECAIKLDKEDMEQFAGYQLSKVDFFPMTAQNNWTLNVYQAEADSLKLIYTQPITQSLNYQVKNTVKLAQPLAVPAADLYVAISVSVPVASTDVLGMDYGVLNTKADLLRMEGESMFYSLYEISSYQGYPSYTAWMINAIMEPSDGAAENLDELANYEIYVDGELKTTQTDTEVVLSDMALGSHTVGVKAVFANGKSSDLTSKNLSIAGRYERVEEVSVSTVGSSSIHAAWETPLDKDATTVTYASGAAATDADYGITGPASQNYALMVGALYKSSMFKGYMGYKVDGFRFYPTAESVFTFMLFENGKQICEQEVEADEVMLNGWTQVKLKNPVTINPACDYKMVIDCYDVDPGKAPMAMDGNSCQPNISDLYSVDEYAEDWSSASVDGGIDGNWMIGLDIVDANAQPVNAEGYRVFIDGKVVNEKLTTNETDYDFGAEDAKKHLIRIDTYYPGLANPYVGALNYFYIGTAGIDGSKVEKLRLTYGNNILKVQGADVESLSVYTVDGRRVAAAEGAEVQLNAMDAGLYLIKVKANGTTTTRKIEIVK
ncbi:MAG: T9SS type A sorting domain-containing protein [Prevotella sp.]